MTAHVVYENAVEKIRRLEAENESLRGRVEQLERERNKAFADAGDYVAALRRYEDYKNWRHDEGCWVWLQPGEGPEIAQFALSPDK